MAMRLNTLTCANKHHMMLLTISCLHLVNNDACEFASPSYQQRLGPDRQDSLVHEGSEFDKLKGGVWEVQRLIYACVTSLIVNTLVKGTGQTNDNSQSVQVCLKKFFFPTSVFLLIFTHARTHAHTCQCLNSPLQAEGWGRLRYT